MRTRAFLPPMTAHTCVASGKIRRGFPFTVAMTGPDSWPGFFSTWILRSTSSCAAVFKQTRNTIDAGLDMGMNAVILYFLLLRSVVHLCIGQTICRMDGPG